MKQWNDKELDLLFEDLNGSLPFAGRQRVWNGLETKKQPGKGLPRPVARLAAIAAACLLLAPVAVFAAEKIRLAIHQVSAEKQAVILSDYDGVSVSRQIHYLRQEHLHLTQEDFQTVGEAKRVRFDTVEEAQRCLPFAIRQPAYLVEGYTLSHISILQYGSGAYDEAVTLYYQSPSGHALYGVEQKYVGEDCEIEIRTTNDIEIIDLDGREAFLEIVHVGSESYELFFLDSGFAYNIFANSWEDAVKTAESLLGTTGEGG